jgi:anti-sigma regulatory factor (Ser/Thr protein kinase)
VDNDPIRGDDREGAVVVFPREVGSIATARRWLTAFLAGAGSRPEPIDDAALVVSELVTNGLRHGLGHITVRVSIEPPEVVHLAVTDSGGGQPVVQPMDPSRVGGVGLRIVADVASDWGVVRFPGGTTVWATLGQRQR